MKKTISLICVAIMLATCTKDVKGPQGDPGPQGTTGPQGPAGESGPKATEKSVTIEPSQWKWDDMYDQWYYEYKTTEFNDHSVVAYTMTGNGKTILPYYDYKDGSTITMSDYLFSSTNPSVRISFENGTTALPRPKYSTFVYLVFIESSYLKKHEDLKNADYTEIKTKLNL